MRNLEKKLRAAIVQAAPVFFDKQAMLQKVVHQIEEAGRNGAQLIVFPESLVPCYPYGLTFGFTVGSRSEAERADWKRYYDQAVVVRALSTFDLAERTSDSYWRSSILYKGWPFSTGSPAVKYFSTISPETRGLMVTALVDLI